MNTVPTTFIYSVARFVDNDDLNEIHGRFGEIAASIYKKNFTVYMNIVYNHDTNLVDYCILRESAEGVPEPYKYDSADYKLIEMFIISICKDVPHRDVQWTLAPRTDPTLLKWLSVPFDYVCLSIDEDSHFECSNLLDLIPDSSTFNEISAKCKYSNSLDRIIQKSNNTKRLSKLVCPQIYENRTEEEINELEASNERLTYFKQYEI